MQHSEALRLIKETFPKYPPTNALEAKNLLAKYDRGEVQFPEDRQADLYLALQLVVISEQGAHGNDAKRADRSAGEKRRQKRTGSRRG